MWIVSLAPQIIDISDSGDRVALGILTAFTDELCACFIAGIKKMGMLELDCDIVLAGSVFMGRTNGLTTMFVKKLQQCAKNANVVNARFEPIVGACIMGILKATGDFDERPAWNAAVTAEKAGLLRLAPELG